MYEKGKYFLLSFLLVWVFAAVIHGENVLASWTFDASPPRCETDGWPRIYLPAGTTFNFTLKASDPYGISSLPNPIPIPLCGTVNLISGPSTTNTTLSKPLSWDTTTCLPSPPSGQQFTLNSVAVDANGNKSIDTCGGNVVLYNTSPWLQIENGDVHVNKRSVF